MMTSGTWSPWSDACEIVSPATVRVNRGIIEKMCLVLKVIQTHMINEFSLQMESSRMQE